jgi:hypothetical protein
MTFLGTSDIPNAVENATETQSLSIKRRTLRVSIVDPKEGLISHHSSLHPHLHPPLHSLSPAFWLPSKMKMLKQVET